MIASSICLSHFCMFFFNANLGVATIGSTWSFLISFLHSFLKEMPLHFWPGCRLQVATSNQQIGGWNESMICKANLWEGNIYSPWADGGSGLLAPSRETGDWIKMCTYSKTKEQSLDVHVLDLQSSSMDSLWIGSQKHHVGFSCCAMLIGTEAAVSELTVLASGQNKQDELSLLGHYFGDKFCWQDSSPIIIIKSRAKVFTNVRQTNYQMLGSVESWCQGDKSSSQALAVAHFHPLFMCIFVYI